MGVTVVGSLIVAFRGESGSYNLVGIGPTSGAIVAFRGESGSYNLLMSQYPRVGAGVGQKIHKNFTIKKTAFAGFFLSFVLKTFFAMARKRNRRCGRYRGR